MHLHLYTFGGAERNQLLLYRVPRETIPDAKDADGKKYG